ncbi:hypothetical protein Droror1_Dr00027980 [Drosera rotundifolia]
MTLQVESCFDLSSICCPVLEESKACFLWLAFEWSGGRLGLARLWEAIEEAQQVWRVVGSVFLDLNGKSSWFLDDSWGVLRQNLAAACGVWWGLGVAVWVRFIVGVGIGGWEVFGRARYVESLAGV